VARHVAEWARGEGGAVPALFHRPPT
jgi:hypothetical protein